MIFKKKPEIADADGLRLLTSLSDEAEFHVVLSLLEAYDIAVFVQDNFSNHYIRVLAGTNHFPSEIYVRSAAYEDALNLLTARIDQKDD